MKTTIGEVLKAMYRIKNGTDIEGDKQLFIDFVNDDRQLFDKNEWKTPDISSICAAASQHQRSWHQVIDKYYILDNNKFIVK